jgi:hypothetical protein
LQNSGRRHTDARSPSLHLLDRQLGTVTAPDAETAIRKAIEEWQIEKRHWSQIAAPRIA